VLVGFLAASVSVRPAHARRRKAQNLLPNNFACVMRSLPTIADKEARKGSCYGHYFSKLWAAVHGSESGAGKGFFRAAGLRRIFGRGLVHSSVGEVAFMNGCRALLLIGAVLAGFWAPSPAYAQAKRDTAGMPIPSWLFPSSEARARRACIDKQPECRGTVRAQIEYEKSISLLFPWIALGIAIIGVLFYLRKQEQKKMQTRKVAQRHHDPAAFRKLDKDRKERKADDEDNDGDRFG